MRYDRRPAWCYLQRELWIRAHSRLGKIPVVLTLLGLSSSLQCTTKPSNFPLWEEKVIFLAFWGVLLISRKGVPTEMLPPNPGVLIHDWRNFPLEKPMLIPKRIVPTEMLPLPQVSLSIIRIPFSP